MDANPCWLLPDAQGLTSVSGAAMAVRSAALEAVR
jgi:hypothetical protein